MFFFLQHVFFHRICDLLQLGYEFIESLKSVISIACGLGISWNLSFANYKGAISIMQQHF